ncbi:MAG: hypothetical protein CME80_11155 [Halomonas sp.]|nr:hypothetical protein [Halomonas sp.]
MIISYIINIVIEAFHLFYVKRKRLPKRWYVHNRPIKNRMQTTYKCTESAFILLEVRLAHLKSAIQAVLINSGDL